MTHQCSARCGGLDGECCYHYPKQPRSSTSIVHGRYEFARGINDGFIVPHNPKILALYRAHVEIEPLFSSSCIGYVVKYATKDSDDGDVYIKEEKYCGKKNGDNDHLHHYAASHVVSSCEAYSAICGLQRYSISPTVTILKIHLPGGRYIASKPDANEDDIINQLDSSMSPLERYFARPEKTDFNDMKYCDYYNFYDVSKNGKPTRIPDELNSNADINSLQNQNKIYDHGNPPFEVHKRKKRIYCSIQLIDPINHELFSLRLLLMNFPAGSSEELKTVNGKTCSTFYEAAEEYGMVGEGKEFITYIEESISVNRHPSELRFLHACFYQEGIDIKNILDKYRFYLSKDIDINVTSLEKVMSTLFNSMSITPPPYLGDPDDIEPYIDNSFNETILNDSQRKAVDIIIQEFNSSIDNNTVC